MAVRGVEVGCRNQALDINFGISQGGFRGLERKIVVAAVARHFFFHGRGLHSGDPNHRQYEQHDQAYRECRALLIFRNWILVFHGVFSGQAVSDGYGGGIDLAKLPVDDRGQRRAIDVIVDAVIGIGNRLASNIHIRQGLH